MNPPLWYFAHPVAPIAPTDEPRHYRNELALNLARARRWLRWLITNQPDVSFLAPWLPYVEVLDDSIPAHRERGIRDRLAVVEACQGIVLCGPRISKGMRGELDHADVNRREVADLVLGNEPPSASWWSASHAANRPLEVGRARWSVRP